MVLKKRILNLTQLASDLSNIAEKFSSRRIQANTFLRIGKPTTENLRPYRWHYGKGDFYKYLLTLTLFLPITMLYFFREVGRLLYFNERKVRQIKLKGAPCKSVFVSHYTNANKYTLEDFYFGPLPSRLNSSGDVTSIFLLNHTRLSTSRVLNEFSANQILNYSINLKTVPLVKLLKITASQLATGVRMMASTLDRDLKSSQRFLLAHAAVQQLSRQTYAVAILSENLEQVLSILLPSRVFITLEGHSFEGVLIRMIHEKFPSTRVLLYQFAPIVTQQFGLIENLGELSNSDLVLTTGQETKQYFLKMSDIPEDQVKVIGSPKAKTPLEIAKKHPTEANRAILCLFAPEASLHALIEMIEIASVCSQSLPSRNFILRLHPALNVNASNGIVHGHTLPNNLVLSTRTLEEDLMDSVFCVYRSTAVSIEGLFYGTRPIHFSSREDDGLDPLAISALEHPSFSNLLDLVSFVDSNSMKKSFDLRPTESEMTDAYYRYFEPIKDID